LNEGLILGWSGQSGKVDEPGEPIAIKSFIDASAAAPYNSGYVMYIILEHSHGN
jgi:hypothetical protein